MTNPEWMLYARALFALIFVIGLIFFVAYIAKRAGLDRRFGTLPGGKRQLSVVESLYVDPRHRLVLVRAGGKEHLLLLAASGNLLIESREGTAPHDA